MCWFMELGFEITRQMLKACWGEPESCNKIVGNHKLVIFIVWKKEYIYVVSWLSVCLADQDKTKETTCSCKLFYL